MSNFRLKIVCTTDLHMEIFGFDDISESKLPDRGIQKLAHLIRDERRNGDCLVLDNGDFLQGTVLADALAGSATHPLAQEMNEIGFDAITLGNHDFDYGVDRLHDFLKQVKAPVLSSNLTCPELAGSYVPWHIKHVSVGTDRDQTDLAIGIVGVLPPQTTDWTGLQTAQVSIEDSVIAVERAAHGVRKAGADIVIALCHSGVGAIDATPGMENAIWPISRIDGIDAIVAGHTHEYIPSINGGPAFDFGKPVIQPGAYARAIGILDLTLTKETDWSISNWVARYRFASEVAEPNPSAALAIPSRVDLQNDLDKVVGQANRPLFNHFAALGHDDAIRLVNEAIFYKMRSGLAGTQHDNVPLLAAGCSFWTSGTLDAPRFLQTDGTAIRERDLYVLAPFNNGICAVRRSGQQLREWLANASAFFSTVVPGKAGQTLKKNGVASYQLDNICGIEYEIDLSQPTQDPNARIPVLKFHEDDLSDEDDVIVAVSSYRAHGGGDLLAAPDKDILWRCDTDIRSLVRDFCRSQEVIELEQKPFWRFSALARTELSIDLPTHWLPEHPEPHQKVRTEKIPEGTRLTLRLPELA